MVRFSFTVVLFSLALGCAKNKEPVEPEGPDLWIPDESLEQARLHEVDPPAVDPYAEMTEEERMAQAKTLYVEAEALFEAEKWKEAEVKYEQAYHLVPGKHGFAYKVAMSAVAAGDCEKAKLYLDHFLEHSDGDRNHHDDVVKARAELSC